jgi:hypothetical protein
MATQYKQPGHINGVSIGLLLVLALCAWVGVGVWPIISVNSGVKNELASAIAETYRANLLPEPTSTQAIARIHDQIAGKLQELGVTDPNRQVLITRGEKLLSIEVRYTAWLVLKGLSKSYPFAFDPKVETDAARAD